MASALLASRNEPYWGERKVYMKKNPNSNPNPRLGPHHNPNPNPNLNRIPYPGVRGGSDANHREQKDDAPAVAGPALSQDSSSFNWNSANLDHRRDSEVPGASTTYVSFNISALSKKELRELKRRLISELEQVRKVASRIESRELQSSARSGGYSASATYCSSREVTSPAALLKNHLSLPEFFTEKEIGVSEAKMALIPLSHNMDLYSQPMASPPIASIDSKNLLAGIMKKCSQILGRLMRNKGSMWFNSPVDVQGMGLHDYRLIIKYPMDLGTVKFRLSNGFYKTPLDFAEDIRLTFNNALTYNPEAHEVHKLAAQLLCKFESVFGPVYDKYEKQLVAIAKQGEEKKMSFSRSQPMSGSLMRTDVKHVLPQSNPVPVSAPDQVPVRDSDSTPVPVPAPAPSLPPMPPPQQQQQVLQQYPITARTMGMKLPKPKARDPNKRPMNFEERQKLSFGLQSLPEEKMNQVLQIVKKRNVDTQLEGDEIVLDFEMMDVETLWELDRFVYNCKKMLSKIKRQGALTGSVASAMAASAAEASLPADAGHKSPMVEDTAEAASARKFKKGDPIDEDVDIGEEMTSTNYPSVEIEKDDGYASSSSSSGSDSSSSSDSDSGSSSGSDSDDDNVRSPVRGTG